MTKSSLLKAVSFSFFFLLGVCLAYSQTPTVIKKTTVNVNNNTTIYFNGSVTVDSGTVINHGTSVNTSDINNKSGNVNSDGTIKLIGSGNTLITTQPKDTFGTVEVNKSNSSATISIKGNIKVDTLKFKSDNLVNTGTDTLFVINSNPNSIQGYNSVRYVNGHLSRKISAATAYYYPVGNSSSYHHAILYVNSVSGINSVTGTYNTGTTNNRQLNVKNEGPYDTLHPAGTWSFKPDKSGTVNYNMQLSTTGYNGLTNNKFAILSRPDGSTYDTLFQPNGGVLPAANAFGRKVADGYAVRNNYTGFSEYGIGMGPKEIDKGILLCVKAFLEGPYKTAQGNMDTNFIFMDSLAQLHNRQPYGKSPWFYYENDTFTKGVIPSATTIDWVLITLRSDSNSSSDFDTLALLIRNDGYIMNTSATDSLVRMPPSVYDSFYVVVKHRNHLGIQSASALKQIKGVYKWDFTTDMGKALTYYGANPMKDISGAGTGPYVMLAGNSNGDLNINATDRTQWRLNNGSMSYNGADFTLDVNINASDRTKWRLNNGSLSQIAP